MNSEVEGGGQWDRHLAGRVAASAAGFITVKA